MVDGGEPMGAENNLTQKLFKTLDSKGRRLKQKQTSTDLCHRARIENYMYQFLVLSDNTVID